MGNFAPGDLHASWVAVWILFLLWWLTMLPRFYYSYLKPREDAEDTGQAAKISRAHKAYNRARDGVLLLLTAVTISFAGAGNEAATNALAYIFMAFWIVIVIMSYFIDSKKLFTILEFLSTILLVALVIMVWGSARGRFLVR